jgi:hypothetical protein
VDQLAQVGLGAAATAGLAAATGEAAIVWLAGEGAAAAADIVKHVAEHESAASTQLTSDTEAEPGTGENSDGITTPDTSTDTVEEAQAAEAETDTATEVDTDTATDIEEVATANVEQDGPGSRSLDSGTDLALPTADGDSVPGGVEQFAVPGE